MAMSVDLPEPDGPIRATNSPRPTARSMPRSAWTAVPLLPKTFVRLWVSMMFMALVVVVLLDLLLGRVLEGNFLARVQARQDLDPLERRDAGLHGHYLEVVLPVVGEPDELGPAREPL